MKVVLVAGGVTNPWNIAFLPGDGGLLVNESGGKLRLVKNGALAEQPVWQVPPPGGRDVLHGLVLHPDFAQNRLVYVSYVKRKDDQLTVANTRRRFSSGGTYFDGGSGNDTFVDQGGNDFGTLTKINFES